MKNVTLFAAGLALAACASEAVPPDDDDDPAVADKCPVIDSRAWSAWVDAMPPGPPSLHIKGEVDMPTPGYTASWRVGAADRMMPPGQHMHIDFTAPDGVVTQVVTTMEVAYEGPAAYPAYREIRVHCGDTMLGAITEIPIVE